MKVALHEVSKCGVFSGPYFPVFGLNTEIYGINVHIQSDTGKYGPEKNLYLDTFHTVWNIMYVSVLEGWCDSIAWSFRKL